MSEQVLEIDHASYVENVDRSSQLGAGRDRERGPSHENKRILHLLITPFRGGVEEHALSLLTSLRNYAFTPFIAAPAPLLDTMRKELAEFRVKSFNIEMQSALQGPRLVARLIGILTKERIDLIHCHSVIASLCAIPAARLCGGRALLETCHGREFWREGKRFKGNFWIDRQASRCVDRIIAVSNAAARFLRESKRISEDKIVVIRNGRDLSSLVPPKPEERVKARAELGLGREPTMLLLGRLAVEKGHASLLEALSLLGSRQPRLVALFAGVGPLETELKTICKSKGLDERVRFLGYRTDLSRLLAAADLVVLPSISEGLPLAPVEALAAARPIVATETGGTPEVVQHEQTGLLVPPNDSAALAEAIHRVLSDPALATRLGTNGRRFVEQHFDVRTQIERTMALYGELTNRATAHSVENVLDSSDGSSTARNRHAQPVPQNQ